MAWASAALKRLQPARAAKPPIYYFTCEVVARR